jgi:hypothetical protein
MTMDDPFFDIINGLDELKLDDSENVVDVTKLTIAELLSKFDELNNDLFELGEAMNPVSQKARDMHSLRSAIYVEIQKRKKK